MWDGKLQLHGLESETLKVSNVTLHKYYARKGSYLQKRPAWKCLCKYVFLHSEHSGSLDRADVHIEANIYSQEVLTLKIRLHVQRMYTYVLLLMRGETVSFFGEGLERGGEGIVAVLYVELQVSICGHR